MFPNMIQSKLPRFLPLLALAATLGVAVPAPADDIDISTVPPRDTVQLTIYNSEDLTLVRETRHITFSKGVNPLQFSWANTLIDPTSVELRFRSHQDDLELIDTVFPHERPQMLYWNIRSDLDGEAAVEITYFTSGLTWAADYVCISDSPEQGMSFEGFVRITNRSGEDYADAQVRLVVGEINLVECVADLARRGVITRDMEQDYYLGAKLTRQMPAEARREMMDEVAGRMSAAGVGGAKRIIKEGLSEYFIFTIEGTDDIADQYSKRMRLFQGKTIPFAVKYRYRPAEYGDQIVRLYLLRNDEASDLGTTPLPDGMLRAYRDNGRDGLSFLAEQSIRYVPIGQEIELVLGRDARLSHELVALRHWRDEFWFRSRDARVFVSPTQGHRIEPDYTVVGWDDHTRYAERLHNDRDRPIEIEFRRTFPGHVELSAARLDDATLHDYQTVQFTAVLQPGEQRDLVYEVLTHQGHNSKQNNVTIVR